MSATPSRMASSSSEHRATVIGAGIVGICCALELQREGFEVTVVDRLAPGEGASFGNAGGVAVGEIVPITSPGVLYKVPGWLMDPMGPLALRWSYLPRMMPWLVQFVRAGHGQRFREVVSQLSALCSRAFSDFQALLRATDINDVLRGQGVLHVYDSRREYESERLAWDLRRAHGLRFEEVDAGELRQLDPDMATDFARVVLMHDWYHVGDPYALVQRLAERFCADGGRIERAEVHDIELHDGLARRLRCEDGGGFDVQRLVVCAGAWSGRLAARLGHKIPLETERGYHTTLADPGVTPKRMVVYSAQGFVITPMDMGLRVAGTVELAGLDMPPNYARARVLVKKARRVYPRLRTEHRTEWMGHRPALPDCLPVIDRAPGVANAYYAFGHGHLGLTLGPTTGRLVSELVTGRTPSVDLYPYRVDRF